MPNLFKPVKTIWDWLGNESNRGRIQFLGAAAIAISGWMVLFYTEISLGLSAKFNPPPTPEELPSSQTRHSSFIAAKTDLSNRLLGNVNTGQAKNIVLITAEGMGVGVNTLFRIGIGQKETGNTGEEYLLPHDRFQHNALIKTYQANAQTTGSGFNDVFTLSLIHI